MKKRTVVTRNRNILVRVSDKEKEALAKMAKSKGMSLSDYIRSAVHRRPVVNLRSQRKLFYLLDRLATEINYVGNNINQAVHAIHLANLNHECATADVKRFNELFEKYMDKREELVKRLDTFYNK